MTKKIVFTGGGSAGHVTPNLALIESLGNKGWSMHYIGSKNGIEKDMLQDINITYSVVKTGKFRRYFSWKTFLEPFNVLIGIWQAFFLLRRIKPDVVFSKGGFVAFPVVVGAWANCIPVIAHESDMTPGLANRLSYPFVDKICIVTSAALKNFKNKKKLVITGTPIRKALFSGVKRHGLEFCGFTDDKPCLLVIGGSLGAEILNRVIRESLAEITSKYNVIHVCGRGKIESLYKQTPGYFQLEYAREELADLFAAATIVLSRSGANSLYEILALGKPHILVPLSTKASRGDQIDNARHFEQKGVSVVIEESNFDKSSLLKALDSTLESKEDIINKIKALGVDSAAEKITIILEDNTTKVCHGC